MIATQQIGGNNSGPYLRQPRVVVMHSTRSGRADFSDSQELGATLNWFVNPEGASSHWVISELERVRVVQDILIAWHSARLNGRAWGIELTQPTIDRPFRDSHYANAALVGRNYVSLGVAPVWLEYWDGGDASGFVAHEDTIQGREQRKSDPGPQFDRARFIASLEDGMTDEERQLLETIQGQVNQLITAHQDTGNDHHAVLKIVQGQVNQLIKQHQDGSSGGLSPDQARAIAKDEIDQAKVKAVR